MFVKEIGGHDEIDENDEVNLTLVNDNGQARCLHSSAVFSPTSLCLFRLLSRASCLPHFACLLTDVLLLHLAYLVLVVIIQASPTCTRLRGF